MMGVEIQAMLRQFSMNAPNKIQLVKPNSDSKNKKFTKNKKCKNKKIVSAAGLFGILLKFHLLISFLKSTRS